MAHAASAWRERPRFTAVVIVRTVKINLRSCDRQKRPMKKRDFRAILLAILLLASQHAFAANANGSSALALASLVAVHSPLLNTGDMILIRRLFNGHFHQLRTDTKTISVTADTVACNVGNIDITTHSCKLTFGGETVNLNGRAAYELYATQAGVSSGGAAGTMSESLSQLVCTINPLEIAKRSGGGADCTFDAGAPK